MENPMLPYSFEERYNHFTKKTEVCLIFSIPIGCFWAKKPGGRCTNCGFQVGIDAVHQQMENIDIIFNDFIGIFDRAMAHIGEATTIVFYTGGSFFEMPKYLMEAFFRRINKIGQIKEVFFETRPEFVTIDNIRLIKELARPDLILKIAIGLESSNDRIREKFVNKGFSKNDYVRATQLIESEGLIPCTYVLLKPLNLSEKEAIEDVVETIKWSHSVGSKLTLLQATFVQNHTPLAKAFKAGKYRAPWLWSIIKILSEFKDKYPIYLGHFEDYPPPIARPQNCGQCDDAICASLEVYRKTNELNVDSLPKCECHSRWLKEID